MTENSVPFRVGIITLKSKICEAYDESTKGYIFWCPAYYVSLQITRIFVMKRLLQAVAKVFQPLQTL